MGLSTTNPELEGEGFLTRLQHVAGDRSLSPWLRAYGMAKGTIWKVMNHAHIPKPDVLLPLIRAENVSLHWLLDDIGPPYRVHVVADDGEGVDYLAAVMEEDGWHGVVYTDGDRRVLVLTRKGQQIIRDQWRDYTILEVIAGGIGERTLQLAEHGCTTLRYCRVDTESLIALARGETAGTYLLTQAPAPPFERLEELGRPPANVAEAPAGYDTGTLTRWEHQVLQAARAVPADQRERALAVLRAFVEDQAAGQ